MSKISWDSIFKDIEKKSANNKDTVIKADNLRMRSDNGYLTGVSEDFTQSFNYRLNEWARRQLFSKLGMPSRYFMKLMAINEYDLVSEHVNYNIQRDKESNYLIRTHKYDNMTERKIRAVLSDSYSKFDNSDLLPVVSDVLKNNYNCEIQQYRNNDLTMNIRVNFLDQDINAGDRKEDDILKVGILVMNSEVGKSGVRIVPVIHRVVCDNGLALWEDLDDKGDFYKRHRWIDKEDMYDWSISAIKEAVEVAENEMNTFKESKKVEIPNPEEFIKEKADLKLNKGQKNRIFEKWQDVWQESSDANTLYAIINSITSVAKTYNPETRFEMESVAGSLIKKVA